MYVRACRGYCKIGLCLHAVNKQTPILVCQHEAGAETTHPCPFVHPSVCLPICVPGFSVSVSVSISVSVVELSCKMLSGLRLSIFSARRHRKHHLPCTDQQRAESLASTCAGQRGHSISVHVVRSGSHQAGDTSTALVTCCWLLPPGPRCFAEAAQPCTARGKKSSIRACRACTSASNGCCKSGAAPT